MQMNVKKKHTIKTNQQMVKRATTTTIITQLLKSVYCFYDLRSVHISMILLLHTQWV